MSAIVVPLPTAALQPVMNTRRRGPYAKSSNVVSPEILRRAILDRKMEIKAELQRAQEIAAWEHILTNARCHLSALHGSARSQNERGS